MKDVQFPRVEYLLQRLLDSLLDAVFILDGAKIIQCSPAAAEMLGYRLDELIGQSMRLVQADGPALDAFNQHLAQAEKQNSLRHVFTHHLRRKSGNILPVEFSVAPLIGKQGRPAGWVCAARDMTQRLQAEQARRESERRYRQVLEQWMDSVGVESARKTELEAALRRVQEVDQFKSKLLSTVSHQLRTPLTSIRGQTSTLLDYADQIGPEERAEALRIIDQEAARLDELIGHVLDLSRLESGTLRVESVATNLGPILIEAVESIAAQVPGHRLTVDVPPGLPLVQANPRRVTQIVRCLIDNAARFSPSGTTVTIKAEARQDMVIVSVRDQGSGIPPEHLSRIFDRYYLAEEGGIRAAGVGLGLAISKGLVEAMGGQISVVSQVDQGSTFSFSLRQTQEPSASHPA